jgi:hypothetical protein
MERRSTFDEIRRDVLEAQYRLCLGWERGTGPSHGILLGYIVNKFDGRYQRPVEELMFSVVLLVLSGGWYWWECGIRDRILMTIRSNGLDAMLSDVPDIEAAQFLRDLRLLKIV